MNELKNLQAEGLTTLGQSLRTAFDLLNLNRLVTGIDNYGQVGWPVIGGKIIKHKLPTVAQSGVFMKYSIWGLYQKQAELRQSEEV